MSTQAGTPEAITGVTRWRKKLVEVDAIQWTGGNFDAVRAFAYGEHTWLRDGSLRILTYGGWKDLSHGDWVGREDGELFCCAEKTFAHNYEPAGEPLTAAQCDRLRKMVTEHQEAVKAIEQAIHAAAKPFPASGKTIVAAWDALKVLSGEEEEAPDGR